jgi:hypothetical protein
MSAQEHAHASAAAAASFKSASVYQRTCSGNSKFWTSDELPFPNLVKEGLPTTQPELPQPRSTQFLADIMTPADV